MDVLRATCRANPDSERFGIYASAGGLAEIEDKRTGLLYTLYRAPDIGNERGWAVLPDGLDTGDAWIYPSCRELLRLVWGEIKDDTEHLLSHLDKG